MSAIPLWKRVLGGFLGILACIGIALLAVGLLLLIVLGIIELVA